MRLKFVGDHSPIVIHGITNQDGGNGISVTKGEIFECPANVAAQLMAKFNEKGRPPKFVEVIIERPIRKPDRNKMMDEAKVKK